MPIITSDDDVLAYQPRWQGPPGIARLKRGLLYGSIGAAFGWLFAEGPLLLVMLLVEPLLGLLLAIVVSVPLVLVSVEGKQQRQLAWIALTAAALGGTAAPALAVVLAPLVHVVLVVRIAEKHLAEPERTMSQRWAVLNAEARYPRAPRPQRLPPVQANPVIDTKDAVTRWS